MIDMNKDHLPCDQGALDPKVYRTGSNFVFGSNKFYVLS